MKPIENFTNPFDELYHLWNAKSNNFTKESKAFKNCFQQMYNHSKRFFKQYPGHQGLCEDAAQEAMIKVWLATQN